MEYFSSENIMVILLAGFSGFNLFFNYLNKKDDNPC
jgi:hypothetical protein